MLFSKGYMKITARGLKIKNIRASELASTLANAMEDKEIIQTLCAASLAAVELKGDGLTEETKDILKEILKK